MNPFLDYIGKLICSTLHLQVCNAHYPRSVNITPGYLQYIADLYWIYTGMRGHAPEDIPLLNRALTGWRWIVLYRSTHY